jgi:hypothetical protein
LAYNRGNCGRTHSFGDVFAFNLSTRAYSWRGLGGRGVHSQSFVNSGVEIIKLLGGLHVDLTLTLERSSHLFHESLISLRRNTKIEEEA